MKHWLTIVLLLSVAIGGAHALMHALHSHGAHCTHAHGMDIHDAGHASLHHGDAPVLNAGDDHEPCASDCAVCAALDVPLVAMADALPPIQSACEVIRTLRPADSPYPNAIDLRPDLPPVRLS